jgi:hypothetical protein
MVERAPTLAGRLLSAVLAAALVAGCAAEAAEPVGDSAPSQPAPTAGPTLALSRGPLAEGGPDMGRAAQPTPPEAAPAPPSPTSRPKSFAMDLYEPGDFVGQYTFEWCVGASLQMALLLTDRTRDRTRAFQADLWAMARDRSSSPFGGANPIGWTQALNDLGIGPYVLVSRPTLEEAVATAATAIRATGRPVGLVMWRGRHAWIMSGFESRGDPRTTPDFTVTKVRVLDPLYPHGSSTWGRSPKPNALISLETLGEQFVPRLYGRVDYRVAPGYVLVLPSA